MEKNVEEALNKSKQKPGKTPKRASKRFFWKFSRRISNKILGNPWLNVVITKVTSGEIQTTLSEKVSRKIG